MAARARPPVTAMTDRTRSPAPDAPLTLRHPLVASTLAKRLKANFVVDNKPGANGNLGEPVGEAG